MKRSWGSFCVLSLFFHLQVPSEIEAIEGIILEERNTYYTSRCYYCPFFFPWPLYFHYKIFSNPNYITSFQGHSSIHCVSCETLPFPSDHAFGLLQNAPKISCLKIIWLRSKDYRHIYPSTSVYICQLLPRILSHLLWPLGRTRILSSITP